jgi:hypothetical protein
MRFRQAHADVRSDAKAQFKNLAKGIDSVGDGVWKFA